MEIIRQKEIDLIESKLAFNPVVSILGPRQCGKTTLVKQYAGQKKKDIHYYDLEKTADFELLKDLYLAMADIKGLVIIDEIQRLPKIFEALRVIVDTRKDIRFLILGSASPDIIKNVSETLAGRTGFVYLNGFHLHEVREPGYKRLWVRGGFPRSYLVKQEAHSYEWREDFIRTFLERDVPVLGYNLPAQRMRRIWTMVAHYHGDQLNMSEIAGSVGVNYKTVRNYLDILCGTYMVRELLPWTRNTKKRLVKAPKIYLRDTGILHALLSLRNEKDVAGHPKCGKSWEGFALEETIAVLDLQDDQVYYWAVHNQAELDLLFTAGGKRFGVEYKYGSHVKAERSMHIAIEELGLEQLFIVSPQGRESRIGEKIYSLPISRLDVLKRKVGL
ncbi:MAG: ATP-binding protein [Candidatus Omnitrophica bacterium]|nr:ATP-binding protein [Candidatus Omnitrophota bacterium]